MHVKEITKMHIHANLNQQHRPTTLQLPQRRPELRPYTKPQDKHATYTYAAGTHSTGKHETPRHPPREQMQA